MSSQCQICHRDLHEDPTNREGCLSCQLKAATMLNQILDLVYEAHLQTGYTSNGDGGSRGKPGSKPPLNVDALDPECTLIELAKGDPSSSVPIIEMLDMWAIQIRHARHLTPHGPATAADPTFTSLIRFHHTHLAWLYQHDQDINAYHAHLQAARRALTRWNTDHEDRGIRIPCPTLTDQGDCGRWLTIRSIDITDNITTTCRDGHEWTARRLIYTIGPDADLWLTADDLATHLGLHKRTIHRWAARGHIRCRNNRYSWADARNLNTRETA